MKKYLICHILNQEGLDLFGSRIKESTRFAEIIITHPQTERLNTIVTRNLPNIHFLPLPNQGRDVLPFKRAFRHLNPNPDDIVVKWHDKRRNHFNGKKLSDNSRERLLDYVMSKQKEKDSYFEDVLLEGSISGVAPAGWLLPTPFRIGANADNLRELARREKLDWDRVLNNSWFPAGMIFGLKASIVSRFCSIDDAEHEIEFGFGGIDGTWAHVSERWIGVLNSCYGAWAEAR